MNLYSIGRMSELVCLSVYLFVHIHYDTRQYEVLDVTWLDTRCLNDFARSYAPTYKYCGYVPAHLPADRRTQRSAYSMHACMHACMHPRSRHASVHIYQHAYRHVKALYAFRIDRQTEK